MSLRYLLAALEPLEFMNKPKMSALRVIELFHLNLTLSVLKNFHHLQFLIDVQNLLQSMCENRLDARSPNDTLSFEKKIQEGKAPHVVQDYFQRFDSVDERIANFGSLFRDVLDYVEKKGSGFVTKYCAHEKKLLVFLSAYRAFKNDKSIEKELFFEDKADLFVAPLITQKGSFTPPIEFRELFDELESLDRNPLKEYKSVAKYRFDLYYEHVKDYGAVDNAVLAYFVCLILLEDLAMLDKQEGKEIVKRLVESECGSD